MIQPQKKSKLLLAIFCLFLLGIIGFFDAIIDYRVSLTVFYVVPIGLATLYVGTPFAVMLAVASILVSLAGDIIVGAPYAGVSMAGEPYPGRAIQLWNIGIVFSLFVIVIYLLHALNRALKGLEAKVEDRTSALRFEMEERKRLQHEILDLTERERQGFGQELHDIICQDLASIAIAGHLLVKKLRTKKMDEAENAQEIAHLVDQALNKTRSLAGGFFTAGFDVDGLAEALRKTARTAEEQNNIRCEIHWQENLIISNEDVVMHFFRIAQEAIRNAVKHAEPSRIQIDLRCESNHIKLTVEDDGKGISSIQKSQPDRLGLRVMAYRASIIGGKLNIEKSSMGGTRIICAIPAEKAVESVTLNL